MKIHLYTTSYNNENILPYFFRHYDTFVDQYFVYDNMSTDGTRTILNSNPKVTVIDNTSEKIDDIRLAQIKNEAWKEKSQDVDWAICCDSDEILYHKNIINLLTEYTKKNITLPKTSGYCMVVENEIPKHDSQIYDIDNLGVEDNNFSKKVIFNPKMVSPNYDFGSHRCSPIGNILESESPELYLLHYKFYTLKYMIDKYKTNASRLSQNNLQHGFGTHYNFTEQQIINEYNDANSRKKRVV
jgi:hypothetical protein